MKKKTKKNLLALFVAIIIAVCGYFNIENESKTENNEENTTTSSNSVSNSVSYEISNIPEYSGNIYVTLNDNIPNFTDDDFNLEEAYYSELVDGRARNGYDKNQLGKSK